MERPPLQLEWEEGSDQIGDFMSARSRLVARRQVAEDLANEFKGFITREVEFPPHVNLMRPKSPNRVRKKRVWLPYEGPELCEVFINHEVELDPKSTVEYESTCPVCRRPVYKKFIGVERRRGKLVTPRIEGQGVFVAKASLLDCDFAKPINSGLMLCTDRVKEFIQRRGYSNIEFWETGETV